MSDVAFNFDGDRLVRVEGMSLIEAAAAGVQGKGEAAAGEAEAARDAAQGYAAAALAAVTDLTTSVSAGLGYTFTYTLADGEDAVEKVDDELVPISSFNRTTGALIADGIEAGETTGTEARPAYPDMSKPHLVMMVGQSWAIPSKKGPALSTSAGVYPGALMPNGGIFDPLGFDILDWQSLVPLVEGTDGRGETPVTGFVRYAFSWAAEKLGARVDGWQVTACSLANGGQKLSFFLPGSAWHEGEIKPALARYAELAPDCGGITFPLAVGGSDTLDEDTTKAGFKAQLYQLIEGVQAWCDQLWGRPMALLFPMYPPTRNSMTSSAVTQAHLEVAREDPRAVIAMASYFNGYEEDDLHWMNWAAKRFGMIGGRVAAQWYAGQRPRAMTLLNATRRVGTNVIRLRFDALTTPGRFNAVDMAQTPDNGLTLYNGGAAVPVTGFTFSGGELLLTVASAATAVTRITYAIGKAAPGIGSDGADAGMRATGNIADSTDETVVIDGVPRTLPNFLTQFDEPVLEISE